MCGNAILPTIGNAVGDFVGKRGPGNSVVQLGRLVELNFCFMTPEPAPSISVPCIGVGVRERRELGLTRAARPSAIADRRWLLSQRGVSRAILLMTASAYDSSPDSIKPRSLHPTALTAASRPWPATSRGVPANRGLRALSGEGTHRLEGAQEERGGSQTVQVWDPEGSEAGFDRPIRMLLRYSGPVFQSGAETPRPASSGLLAARCRHHRGR